MDNEEVIYYESNEETPIVRPEFKPVHLQKIRESLVKDMEEYSKCLERGGIKAKVVLVHDEQNKVLINTLLPTYAKLREDLRGLGDQIFRLEGHMKNTVVQHRHAQEQYDSLQTLLNVLGHTETPTEGCDE